MVFAAGENPQYPEGKTDNTHFTAAGARQVAALAVQEMRRLHLPVAEWLAEPAPLPPGKI
jgi:lysophospholipase L1-like esterase